VFPCSDGLHRRVVEARTALQEHRKRVLHVALQRARGQVQDAHVLDVRALAACLNQGVVRAPERERRKQLFAESVACERAGLANQRPDDMPIVDAVRALSSQPRHRGRLTTRAPGENSRRRLTEWCTSTSMAERPRVYDANAFVIQRCPNDELMIKVGTAGVELLGVAAERPADRVKSGAAVGSRAAPRTTSAPGPRGEGECQPDRERKGELDRAALRQSRISP
jgi:hypothetical protein